MEQLSGGDIVLWFAAGSEDNWDPVSLSYKDGSNSVTVSGVSADKVTLKIGDDGTEMYDTLAAYGAFSDCTSKKIFEDRTEAFLAAP